MGRTSADLSAFEQVEILKGPAALVQGNGSPGGTVNYSFKRPGIEEAFSATMGIGDPTSKIVTLDYNIAPMLNGRLRARFVGSFEDRELFTAPEAIRRSSLYDVTEFDLTERTTIRIGFWQQKNKSNQTFRTGLPTWNDGTLIDFPVETTASQNWNEFNFTARWLNIDIEHEITDGWDAKLPYRRGKSYHPSVYGSMARGGCAGVPGYGSGIDPDNPDGRACYTVEYWSDINEVEAWDGSVTGSFDAFGQTHDLVVGLTHERSWFGREGDQQHFRQLADPEPDDEKRHHRQRGDRMDHADRGVGQPLADMRQALRMASPSPITAPVRTRPAPGTARPPEHPRARHAAQSRPSKPRPSAARRTGYCRTPSSFSPATAGKGQRAG